MAVIIDVEATGIDPLKDRISLIAIRNPETGKIQTERIENGEKFRKVMDILFDMPIREFIAHNGHRFVFPILTKELKR
jgi:uncharacterized protein YprB with RNaseH-like and TPR domain